MTTGGWINLVLSVGFVTMLFTYCIVRVMRGPKPTAEHELAHIEPVREDQIDQR